jgi:phenylacetic acid degradation protein
MIYEFNGMRPTIHPSAFIHQTASVIGNVQIGKDVYIGPGAAIRGDWGRIVIEDGCNVQENCTIHMFPGTTVWLHKGAHVGHGAVIHGATLKRNCLIGMNAVVMDDAEVGEESIVGALCFVPAEMKIPDRKIAVGNPAKIIKDVSDEMAKWKTAGTRLYQTLPLESHTGLIELGLPEVLSSDDIPEKDPHNGQQKALFETWNRTK